MKKYNETLDVLLKLYNEHPEKSADEIIGLAKDKLQIDDETINQITESTKFIAASDYNFNELQQAKKRHISVKAWIMQKIKGITDLVESEEEKDAIANVIGNLLESSVKDKE